MRRVTRFTPTRHAALRMVERIDPTLSEARAFRRLASYAVQARPLLGRREEDHYTVPGTDLVLVVEDKKIVTVLKRTWHK